MVQKSNVFNTSQESLSQVNLIINIFFSSILEREFSTSVKNTLFLNQLDSTNYLPLYKMEEIKNRLKRELRTVSPDELDVLIHRYIKWLNFGIKHKKVRVAYGNRTVERKVTKVLELVKSVRATI